MIREVNLSPPDAKNLIVQIYDKIVLVLGALTSRDLFSSQSLGRSGTSKGPGPSCFQWDPLPGDRTRDTEGTSVGSRPVLESRDLRTGPMRTYQFTGGTDPRGGSGTIIMTSTLISSPTGTLKLKLYSVVSAA